MQNDCIYKPTTATWKINNLLRNNEPLYIIQGGQGAGKTISILMLIIDALNVANIEVTICSAESSKLSDTALRDFNKILDDWGLISNFKINTSEKTYTNKFSNSYCEFIGLDKKDVGKGRRRDIVYINEANKITLQQFADISARAKMVILDFNPDAKFWAHDLTNKNNYIILNYLDNEYLSTEECATIEGYKEKGYNKDGTIKNEFWANYYNVYGLGNTGTASGRVFTNWNKITNKEYNRIDVPIYIGIDWGKNDPMGIIEVKYKDKNLYLRQINYKSLNKIRQELNKNDISFINEDTNLIKWYFKDVLKLSKEIPMVADTSEQTNINTLRIEGYKLYNLGGKMKIIDRIELIHNCNVYYTEDSTDLEFEYYNYVYASDRLGVLHDEPQDLHNHLIDPLGYVLQTFLKQKILQ